MATPQRNGDKYLRVLRDVLDLYERKHKGASAELYRHNPGSIHIRIVDDRFRSVPRLERHDPVWHFIRDHVRPKDAIEEVSMLVLLTKDELKRSVANLEFENPVPTAA